jgi:hypothetical protein
MKNKDSVLRDVLIVHLFFPASLHGYIHKEDKVSTKIQEKKLFMLFEHCTLIQETYVDAQNISGWSWTG